MKTKKRLRLKKKVIYKSLFFLVLILTISFFIMFIRLNILPFLYLMLVFLLLASFNLGIYYCLGHQKYRKLGTILSIILIVVLSIGLNYQSITLNFLHHLSFLNLETKNINIITLKKENYNEVKDLGNKSLALVNDESTNKVENILNKEIKYSKKELDNSALLVDALLDNEVDAILMEDEELKIYQEMKEEFKNEIKVLKTYTIDIVKNDNEKKAKVTKEPFNIYITGIDTYGAINKVSRSDVNIVASINPKTHQILLTSIPRDYYVQLHNTTGLKDKLTHSGLKGIDMSIKTIEDLLEEDINYYLKINFTSLVKIIDALDGIDIDVPFSFHANYQEEDGSFVYYEFNEGLNHLDGKQALAYSRERYDLREGDIGRAKHQQQVIEAMINKLTTSKLLTNYPSLIGSIDQEFATDLSLNDITSLIQMQLKDMPSWTIEKQVLIGTDSDELTYTFPKSYGYVMIPDEESVNDAKNKINEITNNY